MQESLLKILYFMVMGLYYTTWYSLVWKSHIHLFARKWRPHAIASTHQMLYIHQLQVGERTECVYQGSHWAIAPTDYGLWIFFECMFLEMEMTMHSSILAWEIPWTVHGGCKRVRHNLMTKQQRPKMFLEGIIDFWEDVPTQCSLRGRQGLGSLCRFRAGHIRDWNSFSADPRTIIIFWQLF